jgi:mannose/fructose/N-acetylgalactosamine-specific phosphotransferase system component IIC
MLDYTSYVMGMNTFDEISNAIRAGYDNPSPVAKFVGLIFGHFTTGMAIGAGIALVLTLAKAGGL